MKLAFIIMQIGNKELDLVCEKVFVPALKDSGFDPKRIDKHNEGGLLKSEIVDFIGTSDIIIADLTNERPNCYLEVGYTMGLDKFRNLILTAREDHNQDSPNYKQEGPKIHFDLGGYDILFWDIENLDDFKEELVKRINRRLAVITDSLSEPKPHWDKEWLSQHREQALKGLKNIGESGFMEIRMTLPGNELNTIQGDLLNAANQAKINTFGWPIGAMDISQDYRPKPTSDGIVMELSFDDEDKSYDYWTIRKDGSFYLLKSLFEDKSKPGHIFFNTRIVRITETLLYAARLYSRLKVDSNSEILIGIRHGGLKDRILSAVGGRIISEGHKSVENEADKEIKTILSDIQSDIIKLVHEFVDPLFIIFDYYKVNEGALEDIVEKFFKGVVS